MGYDLRNNFSKGGIELWNIQLLMFSKQRMPKRSSVNAEVMTEGDNLQELGKTQKIQWECCKRCLYRLDTFHRKIHPLSWLKSWEKIYNLWGFLWEQDLPRSRKSLQLITMPKTPSQRSTPTIPSKKKAAAGLCSPIPGTVPVSWQWKQIYS